MSSTNTDPTSILETGSSSPVYAVAFHPDGKHVLGGDINGIQQWRLGDGQQVGKQTGMVVRAISVSKDHKWIVCGTTNGASVLDGEMQEKAFNVVGEHGVDAVDVSPDSTMFAIGTDSGDASIWSITSGQRLVGPLKHGSWVTGVQFSPNGERVATACLGNSIRIFDSRTGDDRVTIKISLPGWVQASPLAWSSDPEQIFATSEDGKVRVFDTSTGTQLAESQILHDGNNNIRFLALSTNGKFITTFVVHSIFFLDASTLARIGPQAVIEDSERIRSVAISPDSSRLATGRYGGTIAIRDLGKILPDMYGPFNISTRDDIQRDEQPLTSGDHDSKVPRSTPEDPGKFGPLEPGGHDGGDNDLLECEVLSTPAQFDYDEPLSQECSADGREDEIQSVDSSHPIPQSSHLPPPTEAHADENPDIVKSIWRRSIFTLWLQRKSNRDPTPPKPRRLSGKSRERAGPRSLSPSRARVDDRHEVPARMAASQPKTRSAARGARRRKDKSAAEAAVPKDPNEDTSHSAQESAGANEAGPAQQHNNPSQPSAGRVNVTVRVISFRLHSYTRATLAKISRCSHCAQGTFMVGVW